MDCMTIEDLGCKDVINVKDGSRLGCVCDVQIDPADGCVHALIIFGRARLFGLLGREEDITVPWCDIQKIGEDTILVCCEGLCGPACAPRRRRARFRLFH